MPEPIDWVEPQEWKQVPDPVPLPAPAIDNHTHLDATGCRTADDVTAAMARARAVNVVGAITVADDLASARWAAWAAGAHADVWAAIGLHPTRADVLDDATRTELAALAAGPRVVAVGETGLDHYWDAAPHDAQREAFAWHIALAKQLSLPLMIHDRDAHEAVFDVLAAEGAPDTVVFHCFSGDAAMARTCADRGYFMSFAGPVSFKNARDLHAAVRLAPEELLMVETDAPFLAPHPHRGRKNGPYALPYTVRAIAEMRETDTADLLRTVTATTERVYTLGDLRSSAGL